MHVTYILIIAFQQNAFGIAVSSDPSSLSSKLEGRDQTTDDIDGVINEHFRSISLFHALMLHKAYN